MHEDVKNRGWKTEKNQECMLAHLDGSKMLMINRSPWMPKDAEEQKDVLKIKKLKSDADGKDQTG